MLTEGATPETRVLIQSTIGDLNSPRTPWRIFLSVECSAGSSLAVSAASFLGRFLEPNIASAIVCMRDGPRAVCKASGAVEIGASHLSIRSDLLPRLSGRPHSNASEQTVPLRCSAPLLHPQTRGTAPATALISGLAQPNFAAERPPSNAEAQGLPAP